MTRHTSATVILAIVFAIACHLKVEAQWLSMMTPQSCMVVGGTVSTISGWEIHVFDESGTLTITGHCQAEYLAVGGGGGGGGGRWGFSWGQTGGAAAVVMGAWEAAPEGIHSISVGHGGTGGRYEHVESTPGTPSYIGDIIVAPGGPGGKNGGVDATPIDGVDGITIGSVSSHGTGGYSTGASGGQSTYGHHGGRGYYLFVGGSGGAGGPGGDAAASVGGAPGACAYSAITGTTRGYGCGAEGNVNEETQPEKGSGAPGCASSEGQCQAPSGADGIVIIRVRV